MKFDKFCKKQEIGYQNINNKEIENIFLKLDSKTLIISANIFLFLQWKVVEVYIINHSYLMGQSLIALGI